MSNKPHTLPNLKTKAYGGAWSIQDDETLQTYSDWQFKKRDTQEFCHNYKDWFIAGHELKGIESYNDICFTNGTTETFDKFYHRHAQRRLRLFKGEYFYHQIMSRFYKDFEWIENDDIRPYDVLVVSCPFSDTGNKPVGFDNILEQCNDKMVPVCLDLAYINISKPVKIDLSLDCIEDITTSLSKVFPVEHNRIGIRLQKNKIDDSTYAYNQNEYVNHNSVSIGQHMIENFTNNFITEKYAQRQIDECNLLSVTPSQSVIFGIDTVNKYSEYNRGGASNRLCFSRVWDNRANV